ncbi:MAG: short subunit dehydrogenase-like uncharacterized protein [Saprospiraceae bacterium]|jgi:short subunit dehydrogenase-like uncharacterized protein
MSENTPAELYDVVVFGATGFTGKLVAEYLFKKYGVEQNLRWAIAGRSESKLQATRQFIASDKLPYIVVDSTDKSAIDDLVQSTKVVCTTVGPYAKYGSSLVASCVTHGVDYCDLSGEVQWMRKMIDLYHEKAIETGARIVHSCGFDSIPSDMGVFFLQEEVKKRIGGYAKHVKFRVKAMKGGFSGGTYASLTNVLKEAEEDKSIFITLLDPYGLNPKGQRQGDDNPDFQKVIFDKDLKQWIAPFVMATINTKNVRRSHALSSYKYGRHFRYDEAVITGPGLGGRIKGIGMTAALGAMMAGKPGSMYRKLVDRFLPDPGEGPNAADREAGFFNILLLGLMQDDSIITAQVKGDRDPGYGSTSKMLGESAVCLALDRDKTNLEGGVTTPSIAMGNVLLQRLQDNAGLTFTIKD